MVATGLPKTRIHPITGQSDRWQFCRPGHPLRTPIGSRDLLIFRSWCLGYYDLDGNAGTMHFGGQRPGCWIMRTRRRAASDARGQPPAACRQFPQHVQHRARAGGRRAGIRLVQRRPTAPVRRLGILFGTAGRGPRKDAAGNLWLGYPRPRGSLILPLALDVSFSPAGNTCRATRDSRRPSARSRRGCSPLRPWA